MSLFRGQIARAALTSGAMLASMPVCAGTQTGVTKVVTITPLNIINTAPLDFGSIIPAAAAGTVTINAQTGVRTATTVTLAGGAFSTAAFVAAGTALRVVTLTLNPATTITISNGANTMTINRLRVSADGGGQQTFGPNHTLNAIGVITFNVGGRLNVGANQASGLYTGTFTLTMDYQ